MNFKTRNHEKANYKRNDHSVFSNDVFGPDTTTGNVGSYPSGELINEIEYLVIVCSNTKFVVDLSYIKIDSGLS